MRDVRCNQDLSPNCGTPNYGDFYYDYAGELRAVLRLTVTDRVGAGEAAPATAQTLSFPFDIACTQTSDIARGSDCAVATTADTVLPGAVAEGARSVWELGRVAVFDGGADGDPDTPDSNGAFLKQGVFIP